MREVCDNLLLIIVYVDDILILSLCSKEINKVYNFLRKSFDVKNLGDLKYCLGMEFSHNNSGITLSQKGYIRDILDRFQMPVATPIDVGTKL